MSQDFREKVKKILQILMTSEAALAAKIKKNYYFKFGTSWK